jgi:hypothetical protein
MSKTKVLIKIVPVIGLIVIVAAIIFIGISFYLSFTILSEYFTDGLKNNQSKLIQKALLEEFESNSTDPDPLINELDTDNQTSSDAYDITETMKGFIDLYDLYNLQVLAILTGDDVESVAVIKNPKNNETRQYYEGDSIRGAIVLQILSNKVIVRWNDHKIE